MVFAAVKADWLEKTNCAVEETGLRPSIVDLATMALYNAFRYNYSELSGCSLLIDIGGARTTNLLSYRSWKDLPHPQKVSIYRSSITAANKGGGIHNEPFAAAEFRKKRDAPLNPSERWVRAAGCGRVAWGKKNRKQHDDAFACGGAAKADQPASSLLHAERSTSQVSSWSALISGGGASTGHIQEFFQEKLRQPVQFFNPLRKVAVEDS